MNWSMQQRRYMITKAQYEAALRLCDWEWASKIEPELAIAKQEYLASIGPA